MTSLASLRPAPAADRPAALGGAPVRTRPFGSPRHRPSDLERLADVLAQPDWGGIPFPNVMHERARRAFGAALGVDTVLVANGTVALSIALRALELPAGAEVIVPALTWVATAAAVVHVNCVPVLVDVEPLHYCLDPDAIEDAITPLTRAIIVVHLANQVADMDRIMAIASRRGLHVIEDCAHAHFAAWRGRSVGTIGDVGTYSFESSKIMTSGEGGAVASRHAEVLARAMSLTHVGWKLPPYDGFAGQLFGFNARLSEFQAAMLIGQIESYTAVDARRRGNLARLVPAFGDLGLDLVAPDARVTSGQVYEVLFRYRPEAFAGLTRDAFCRAVLAEGVEIEGAFYEPLHRSPLFRPRAVEWPCLRPRYGDGFDGTGQRLPVAERAAAHDLVWLHHPLIGGEAEDVDDIVAAVERVRRHAEAIRAAG